MAERHDAGTVACNIVSVGKRRDGGTRYWCIAHRADATAKYGVRAERCRYADIEPAGSDQILEIDPGTYAGGVALWGAVPPIYDTTMLPLEGGIHVHARKISGGEKALDNTFRGVRVTKRGYSLLDDDVEVCDLDAIYFMTASIFGYTPKFIACSHCGHPHLDKDWFSVHPHQTHLCSGCGRHFRDSERAVGNPAALLRDLFPRRNELSKPVQRQLTISQRDYPGGIQIWGSNPAIVWTADRGEESGVHVHALLDDGPTCDLDDTYSSVVIDGVDIDASMTQTLMAQQSLPHIRERVVSLTCLSCGVPHFDTRGAAFTPHDQHVCHSCGAVFASGSRMRLTISNPLMSVLNRLSLAAVRPPRNHVLPLLPETL